MKSRDIINIGVFGASFDPPHIAHFIIAEWCADELGLERVILIPAAQNPFKLEHRPASPETRLEMTVASAAGNSLLQVSSIEINRGGVSYTIDTITELQKIYPSSSHRLFLLLGADCALDFRRWKNYRNLAESTTVAVFNRPGYDLNTVSAQMDIPHITISVPNFEMSSTMIRERIIQGLSWKYMVPAGVAEIIETRKLYK